jgi:RHS repeat-associated protein
VSKDLQGRENRYVYDPYGELEKKDPTSPTEAEDELGKQAQDNPFRYEGFYYDSGVKTYDMQARNYRPDIGRFLSQDRFESARGDFNLQADPLTQNRYVFGGANPTNNIEFDGHEPPSSFHRDRRGRGDYIYVGSHERSSTNPSPAPWGYVAGRSPSLGATRPQARVASAGSLRASSGLASALSAAGHGLKAAARTLGKGTSQIYKWYQRQRCKSGSDYAACIGSGTQPDPITPGRVLRDTAEAVLWAFPEIKSLELTGRAALAVRAFFSARRATRAAKGAPRGGAGPVRVGQAGEDAVRSAYDIGPKVPIRVAGRDRIPDGLTTSRVSEVKNVGSLSYSSQLRDYVSYAQQTGRQGSISTCAAGVRRRGCLGRFATRFATRTSR